MKNYSAFFAITLLALTAFGCRSCETIDSSKLDPSEIYQEYSVTVNDSTISSAEFRVSGSTGTTVALVAPSAVQYNGQSMSEHLRTTFSGTYYSSETKGFVGSHTFVFTDSSGKKFTNVLSFEPISISSEDLDLSRSSKSLTIPISRSLADGESLTATLISDAQPPRQTANTNSNSSSADEPQYSADLRGSVDNSSRSLKIDGEQIRKFVAGKAKLHLYLNGSRKPAEIAIRGGNMNYSIQSPTVRVNVSN